MMFIARKLLAASLLLAAGGCVLPVPLHYRLTPHVAGTVLDENTKAPVPQAHLHWERFPERIVSTSVDGWFDFPAMYDWELWSMNNGYWEPTLVIGAPGYQTTNFVFHYVGDEIRTSFTLTPLP